MRPIQQIFDVVVDGGFYPNKPFMCFALYDAWKSQVISRVEYDFAQKEIEGYLGGCATLARKLDKLGSSYDIRATTHVYRNWANRPMKPLSFWQRILSSIRCRNYSLRR